MFDAVPRRTVLAGLMAVGLAATSSAHTLPATGLGHSRPTTPVEGAHSNYRDKSVQIMAVAQYKGAAQLLACDPDTCNTHVLQQCDPENCGAQVQ